MAFSLVLSAGQYWEGSFWWEADSWDDMWRVVAEMHEHGPVSVQVGGTRRTVPADADDVPFWLCGVIDGVWVYRHDQIDGVDVLEVFGAELPVVYDTVFLRQVQVEAGDPDDDPAPVSYWLPRELLLSIDEADVLGRRLAAGEPVASTVVLFEPESMNYG